MDFDSHVEELPFAHGGQIGSGQIKERAENFRVNETLTFEPSGEGEHVFLYIQKTDLNTGDVTKILSKHADVTRHSVAYAGMKDRRAVSKQWFSVQLPGKEGTDWNALNNDQILIESVTRHAKKLKRGTIKHNQFEILISNMSVDNEKLEQKALNIENKGVPNYFMRQRFGYQCQNLSRTFDFFIKKEPIRNKKLRGIFLSSARSFLFNKVLAQRVNEGVWDKAIQGDAFMLNGTRQCFYGADISSEIHKRMLEHDISATGPLFGVNKDMVQYNAQDIEQNVFSMNDVFCDGLRRQKMETSRRALRVIPEGFKYDLVADDALRLSFKLPSGSYATAVIRELIDVSENSAQ
ncbi:MAG: tRNA pseudouridine synthase D [Cycloclasticus sp. symbiont of Poecilosclerida sp. N]|nr:MAG: tRNA pseudouridine synthase D [Cycloclasticus sp. symbiont of Poecilosclerida sp. N]